jgi:hypothetical protein
VPSGARRLLALAAVAIAACGGSSDAPPAPASAPPPGPPTFARAIAPIVWTHCAPCHRPGEAGPFPLLSYRDVAKRAKQIETVTRTRYMPPWKPLPGYATYAHDASLPREQIDLIRVWVADGAPEGNPADLPPLPTWPVGWQGGTPDLVLQMPAPYTLQADGRDVYRNFVFPTQQREGHWISGWELRTNGATAIHHAIVNVDRRGWARAKDAEDAEPGYPGMDPGDIQAPDGFYLVWTPGKAPSPPVAGTAWRLDAGADLVVQLHLQPTGRTQVIQPTLGLTYTDQPPTKARITIKLGDPPIDIPAGQRDYKISDTYELPVDTDVLGLFPHAHYLAKKMRVWAIVPGGKRVWLLAIDDWDFAWQQEYTFTTPLRLPRGSVVHMEFTYDNSADNERNPNQPPKRVTSGARSVDEMGNITLELSPPDPHDLDALRESKYRGMLARAPNDARGHFNLANTLSREGKRDDAMAEYRTAKTLDPKLAPAAFNLGNLLLQAGRAREAAVEFQAAIGAQAVFPEAELNLGQALAASGDRVGGRAHVARALALRPGYPEALAAQAQLAGSASP